MDTYQLIYVFFSKPFLHSAVPMVLDRIIRSEMTIVIYSDHEKNES
jgi:hypothetical protein